MYRLTQHTLRAGLALALSLGLAWSASAQPEVRRGPDLDARLDRLGERLDVTDAQAAALDAISARDMTLGPAASWTAAADVLDVLTDEQVTQLREMRGQRGDRIRGQRRGDRARSGRGQRGARGQRQRGGQDARQGRRGERGRAPITDAQRQAIRAVRDDVRDQRQALVQRLRDGSISDDAFVQQSQALREDGRRRMQDARPAASDGDRPQQREAARAARKQALGLTDAQEQRVQALRLDRIRQAPERLDMRLFLDADGQLDRPAYREAQQERRQQAQASAQSIREQTGAVYTDRQRDLMMVHRALAAGGRDGRRGRRGER